MFVYVVSKVSNEEYGDTRSEKIFATKEGAQAYMAELIYAEDDDGNEVKMPRSEVRYFPWWSEDEDGQEVYSVKKWEAC